MGVLLIIIALILLFETGPKTHHFPHSPTCNRNSIGKKIPVVTHKSVTVEELVVVTSDCNHCIATLIVRLGWERVKKKEPKSELRNNLLIFLQLIMIILKNIAA